MSKKRIWLLASAGAIVCGLVLAFSAFAYMGFDITQLNTARYTDHTYDVDGSFSHIVIESAECDIRLVPSEDGKCRVDCQESDKIYHEVTLNGDTLTVTRVDSRKWYENRQIGFYWGDMEVVLHLPQKEYETLQLKTLSGDILIPEQFSFSGAELQSTSGDITFSAPIKNDLSLKTVSGDVHITNGIAENLEAHSTSGEIKIEGAALRAGLTLGTVSGDIRLSEISCADVKMSSTSGDIHMTSLVASGTFRLETVSGDLRFDDSDAQSLWIKTVSGNVRGTLLTEKTFTANTTSGIIDVPPSASGGKCEVKTTSGDVRITVG